MTDAHDLDAAIAELRRVTPANDPWRGQDFNSIPAPIDDTICTVLNAVARGELVRALPSVGVTVKPLEWDGFVAGNYRIDVEQGGIANLWFYSAAMVENEEPKLLRGGYLTLVSIDELKETAQAHHNACTMAALDVQPAPDVAQVRAEALREAAKICDRIIGGDVVSEVVRNGKPVTRISPAMHDHAVKTAAVYLQNEILALITTPPAPSPDVQELIDAAKMARNRLELIADKSWRGDGRDLKRSIVGVFADFDAAIAREGGDA